MRVLHIFQRTRPLGSESDTAGNGKVLAVQDGEEYITIARWEPEPATTTMVDGSMVQALRWVSVSSSPIHPLAIWDLVKESLFLRLINDLILEKDTSAPTSRSGNNPFTVMQNGQYSDGVEVVDNRDPKPKLSSLHPIRSTWNIHWSS